MFLARQVRHDRQRSSTLERRYAFHRGEAVLAGLQGSQDKAAGHSRQALLISRELCAAGPDPDRHAPALAAALTAYASYSSTPQSAALLDEAARRYAVLAAADPAAYEVPRIGVLTRMAVEADAEGRTDDAIGLLREVTGLYRKAPAGNAEERDLGLARACFHLGRCLRQTGREADGLAATEDGLVLAADVAARLGLTLASPGWLAAAPCSVQLAAPDWAAAAVRAMTGYAAAGRWLLAAASARTARTVAGGLAELGGDMLRDAYAAISVRAAEVLAQSEQAEQAGRTGPGQQTPRARGTRTRATGVRGVTRFRSGESGFVPGAGAA